MILGQFLYAWLVVVALLDAVLVWPALRRADEVQTIGRLIATECVLLGLALSAGARLAVAVPLTIPVAIGLTLVDLGLLGYALFLPERGVLQLVSEGRARRRA